MTKAITLAEAEAQLAQLRAEAEAGRFSSPDNIKETLVNALVEVVYEKEPQQDSKTGKPISRVNLETMTSLLQFFIGSEYTCISGKKYTNIIRN